MGDVVDLVQYKASATTKPKIKRGVDVAKGIPHYWCQRCDTDQFKLFATGAIHCGDCGALIRNLSVQPKGEQHGQTSGK